MQRRKRREGMTLIEIMVVLVIMSAIASLVGFAVVRNLKTSRIHEAEAGTRIVQGAVTQYFFEHAGDCPVVDDLLKAEFLDRTTKTKDPWDHDYIIECEGNTVHVHSNGEDGQSGTEDDIGF